MSKKPWHLDRRTFLLGTAGVSLSLPLLECMGNSTTIPERPKRLCAVYFPYGAMTPRKDSSDSDWGWMPQGEGRDYTFNKSLKSLEPFRDQLTFIKGMSHLNGRRMGGHDTADIWLTGAQFKGGTFRNSVSIDQLAADHFGDSTRFSSLTMSTDGGVGEATRSSTLSFGRNGTPVPAQNRPRLVFNRFFGINSESADRQRKELENSGSMLDLLLEHSKTVRRKLGKQDLEKFDEYLDSVRAIEQRVDRSQRWLDIPKPDVESTDLNLDSDHNSPEEYIRTMYDLIFLAFQTDSTRVATYQLGNMNGATSIAGQFPQLLGFGKKIHALAHGWNKKGGGEALGKWDQYLAKQLTRFLERLQETKEGEGNLLDHTMVLYGSSNSTTHNNNDYPLLLAGGNQLGLKHGQLLEYSRETPLTNLHVTMLNRLGVPTESFVDSTGELTELI
ncbi:DUF1552 domain-containing protein [bacterium]|nr:DUF1552 domain-containing protein [Mariniblastus sp.]MDB4466614.1 DUF1552 domain-containing protein [bacterium]